MAIHSFTSLPLDPELLKNIESLEYHSMTPIQQQCLPHILNGKDVIAQAKTGSGKTASFAIGILHNFEPQLYVTQALVICPTRELADQVSKEFRQLARTIKNTNVLTLCGGKPLGPQLTSLQRNPHIVVGTPGRLLKHLQKDSLKLNRLKTLVLDEADTMLDLGFIDDITNIIKLAPNNKQTLLFSATYPDEIKSISQNFQNQPVDIQLESIHSNKKIKQVFYEIKKGERTKTLVSVLEHYRPESSLVFCNRKQQCQELADDLWKQGFHALALHGDLNQKQRDQVLVQAANKSTSILVATDVAARGLDIKDLDSVIIFEISPDPEVHIHRIGRTGRAEKKGLAVSLFMTSEIRKVNAIEDFQNSPVTINQPSTLKSREHFKLSPPMVCLCINGGRKEKVRAGDILGALTANTSLPGKQIGKIDIFDHFSYVAVERQIAKQALTVLTQGKIKGRKFRVKKIR